jgi:hypothetical protein
LREVKDLAALAFLIMFGTCRLESLWKQEGVKIQANQRGETERLPSATASAIVM